MRVRRSTPRMRRMCLSPDNLYSSQRRKRTHTHASCMSFDRYTTSLSKICLLSRGGLQQLQTSTISGWTRKEGSTWKGSLSARFVLNGPSVLCNVIFPFLKRNSLQLVLSCLFYLPFVLFFCHNFFPPGDSLSGHFSQFIKSAITISK